MSLYDFYLSLLKTLFWIPIILTREFGKLCFHLGKGLMGYFTNLPFMKNLSLDTTNKDSLGRRLYVLGRYFCL